MQINIDRRYIEEYYIDARYLMSSVKAVARDHMVERYFLKQIPDFSYIFKPTYCIFQSVVMG